jgi:hypothetical protein
MILQKEISIYSHSNYGFSKFHLASVNHGPWQIEFIIDLNALFVVAFGSYSWIN